MISINFIVDAIPIAKGRPRFAKRGNFVSTYTPTKTRDYESMIADQARHAMGSEKPLEGPLKASIHFYMPVPVSYSKTRQNACFDGKEKHTKKPDLDNLTKAVLDSMNYIVFSDDSQIVQLSLQKHYSASPRIEIKVTEFVE